MRRRPDDRLTMEDRQLSFNCPRYITVGSTFVESAWLGRGALILQICQFLLPASWFPTHIQHLIYSSRCKPSPVDGWLSPKSVNSSTTPVQTVVVTRP